MRREEPEFVFVPRYPRPSWSERVAPAYLVLPAVLGVYLAFRKPDDWLGWMIVIGVGVMGAIVLHSSFVLPRRLLFGSQLVIESRLASNRIPYHEIDLIEPGRIGTQQGTYWLRTFENREEFQRVLQAGVSRGWLASEQIASELGGPEVPDEPHPEL